MVEQVIGIFRRWLVIGAWLLAMAGISDAHSMKQVRAEITAGNGGWEGSVWLEAWALYPEDGPKVPPGTPGDPRTAGNDWVKKLDAADHKVMREVAAEFLTETFVLTLDGKRLAAEFSFPEYTKAELPELKENDDGNSLVRIDLRGRFPAETTGLLELTWQDDEDEPLALEVKVPELKLLRLAPKAKPVELMMIGADGAVTAGNESSLLSWTVQGFRHILPLGLDHICFILGLFLLQPKWKPLLWQTSAFTVAHSITLALVVLGVFTAPAKVVEPMIALSIAYVGIENLWVKELKPWRVALVFALGLLHGMGFASVMKELELPEGQVIEPLVGFNLGVELGQVTVLASAFAVTVWFLNKPGFGVVRKVASGLIGAVGLYWTFERIFG
ncbi:MAG: HupE/UreJ family protein [Verrucomicrobiota bacterium]